MSEETIKIWERVVEKGVEKLKKALDAMENKQPDFKQLHQEYGDYIKKVSETTGIREAELDNCFLEKYQEKIGK